MASVYDPVPDVAAAGIYSEHLFEDSTALAMTPQQRPQTPDKIQKWRRSYYETRVGEKSLPIQSRYKLPVPDSFRFGQVNANNSQQESNVLPSSKHITKLSEYFQKRKEEVYRSNKREPLGAPYVRGYNWPEKTKHSKFAFGVGTNYEGANMAREAIHATDDRHLVRRSDETSQKIEDDVKGKIDLKYDWKSLGFDPTKKTFGSAKETKTTSASDCLSAAQNKILLQKTSHANFRTNTKSVLGETKPLPHVLRNRPHNFVYGHTLKTTQNFGVKECIHELDTLELQQPDKNIGRTNVVDADYRIRYGLPSIRFDRKRPVNVSIANTINYGGEDGAYALISPTNLEQDFYDQREINVHRSVFEAAGIKVTDEVFERIREQAKVTYGDTLSLLDFQTLYNQLKKFG